jgi:regulator of protease activity HflC (stomatin/prohibitin superfamily)
MSCFSQLSAGWDVVMKYGCVKRIVFLLFAAIVVCFVASESFYTINEQDRGVVLRNGKFVAEAQPGWGWKIPFVDKVTNISMQNNLAYWGGFQARTEDFDLMELEVSIVWRVAPDEVLKMYKKYTTLEAVENVLLIPKVTEQARLIVSHYSTEQALKNREAFIRSFSTAIRTAIDGPVIIESIDIGSVHMKSMHIE